MLDGFAVSWRSNQLTPAYRREQKCCRICYLARFRPAPDIEASAESAFRLDRGG